MTQYSRNNSELVDIYTDDVLFDDFVDAHFDDALESELDQLMKDAIFQLIDFVGEERLAKAFGRKPPEYEQIAAAPSEAFVSEIVDQLFEEERFTTESSRSHSYSYFLKSYAFLGTAFRTRGTDIHKIERLVNWGDRMLMVPGCESKAPMFTVIARGARARSCLDTGRKPDFDDYVCLLAIARWPVEVSLSHEILDLPKKTVQNLISAKTIGREADGRLEHKSAFEWIKGQFAYDCVFPSADIVGSNAALENERTLHHPVLVPLMKQPSSTVKEPLLPDAGENAIYRVELSSGSFETTDYFALIEQLPKTPTARLFLQRDDHVEGPYRLTGEFVALERQDIEKLIAKSPKAISTMTSSPENMGEMLAKRLGETSGFSVFRKGHSKKLFRFASVVWGNIAVEPLKFGANVYLPDTHKARERFSAFAHSSTGPGPTGRNSNLNPMEHFKGHSLLVLRVTTLDELSQLIELV